MLDDFIPIIHKFPNTIKIIPIADMHIGSKDFAKDKWKEFKRWLLTQENTYIVIAGDILDNVTRCSVGSVFDATMRPSEQKRWLAEELKPIKHLILAGTKGNHEARSLKDVDDDPLYDVFCKLDIEDRYRTNACFVKIMIGNRNEITRNTYSMLITHGVGSKPKTEKFNLNVEGIDIFITGHTHRPSIEPSNSKLVFDTKNNCITYKPIYTIVTTSWLNYGGYALNGKYLPISFSLQEIILHKSNKKNIEINTRGTI